MTDVKKVLKEKFAVESENLSEDTISVVAKVIDSHLNLERQNAELTTKLTSETDKVKELITSRDGLKAELGVIRTTLFDKTKFGDEELKKLYNEEKSRADKLDGELSTIKSEFTKVSEQYKGLHSSVRNEIVSKFPEGSNERKFAESIQDLTALNEFSKLKIGNHADVDGGKGGNNGEVKIVDGKRYDEYTTKELEWVEKNKPEVFNKLINDKYK